MPDNVRSDSSSEELLEALNTATGELLTSLDANMLALSPRTRTRQRQVKRIRRLVNVHLRQRRAKSDEGSNGD